jgi:hypothetical protein
MAVENTIQHSITHVINSVMRELKTNGDDAVARAIWIYMVQHYDENLFKPEYFVPHICDQVFGANYMQSNDKNIRAIRNYVFTLVNQCIHLRFLSDFGVRQEWEKPGVAGLYTSHQQFPLVFIYNLCLMFNVSFFQQDPVISPSKFGSHIVEFAIFPAIISRDSMETKHLVFMR